MDLDADWILYNLSLDLTDLLCSVVPAELRDERWRRAERLADQVVTRLEDVLDGRRGARAAAGRLLTRLLLVVATLRVPAHDRRVLTLAIEEALTYLAPCAAPAAPGRQLH